MSGMESVDGLTPERRRCPARVWPALAAFVGADCGRWRGPEGKETGDVVGANIDVLN